MMTTKQRQLGRVVKSIIHLIIWILVLCLLRQAITDIHGSIESREGINPRDVLIIITDPPYEKIGKKSQSTKELIVEPISKPVESETVKDRPQVGPFSEEDKTYLKLVSYAEAGIDGQDAMQAVMHCIYNLEKQKQLTSIKETVSNGFSSVVNGNVTIRGEVITEEDLPDSVTLAYNQFIETLNEGKDITQDLLKTEAERLGISDSKYWEKGAMFFYNPDILSSSELEYRSKIKVQVKIGQQLFFGFWDL